MKIAIDPQIFQTQKYGGISRYFYKLADHFYNHSQDVAIISPGDTNSYIKNLPSHIVLQSEFNNWLEKHPIRIKRRTKQIRDLITMRMMHAWNPDIVHETYYRSRSFAPKNTPVILTVYDMIHEIFPESFPANDSTRNDKRNAINRADHIICISNSTKQDLIKIHRVREEKITVIHLGFDQFKCTDSSLDAKFSESPYLLYVGLRGGYKNFENMLRAYASSPRLKKDFRIIAFGGPPFGNMENNLISELKLDSTRVVYRTGSDSALYHYYRRAEAFVYPSLYEGFGLPPLEAMSLECPVIASKCSCIPEILGDAAQYFEPSSIDSIREEIEKVCYHGFRKDELIQKGLHRIKQFSWEKCADQTIQLYRDVSMIY